jgi:hypothetical protein
MFERAIERARLRGAQRARDTARRLAGRAAAEAPSGVRVEAVEQGVRLSGRALRLRMVTEPALRWLIGRVQ